jgi:polyisoprenyl-teichoic acid--peptidoglycan teichoic acid transferase
MNRSNRVVNILLVSIIIFCVLAVPTEQTHAHASENKAEIAPDWFEEQEPMTILVVGTDSRSRGYLYGLGDTIMVFRIDFQERDVRVIGFPRDLWVKIPDVEEDNGRTHGKINQAYFFGSAGMGYYSGEGDGAGLLQATFQENWGFEIDHYIVINMTILREVIDALGGVKFYSPAPVYSFHQPNQPKYLAGGYYFMGKEALLYARYRDPKNVLDRVDRQKILIKALCESVFELETIPKIPELIGLFRGNVLTDLSLAELSRLLYLSGQIPLEEVIFTRVPKTDLNWSGTVWLEKEPGRIQEILDLFQAGEWPLEDS